MTDTDDVFIESPCVDNCRLDEDSVCLGCFLSREEIDHWNQADTSERLVMLRNASRRQREVPETEQ